MNRLKKLVTGGVLITTILSLTVVVKPASAAAMDGDLIKMSGLSTVYYFKGGKRYVFPNQKTYITWYSNTGGTADFSKVKTISQSELESYPLGGNVVYRPGTRLVKITTNPTVYAVEPNGVLRAIASEAQASSLYGPLWNKTIDDVSDAFFTNYTVGSPLEANKYPIGQILTPNNTDLYYYDGTNYRKFANDAALAANGFNTRFVVTTTMAITAGGTQITGAESALMNAAQAGSTGQTGGVVTGTGSGLTVALASDTPAAATYIRDNTNSAPYPAQIVAPFTKINFTASNDGDVVVSSVKLTRSGISADTDLSNVYLYDGNTKLAEYTSFSNKVITFTNSAGLFTVAKGTTKTITVKADIASNSTVYASTVSGLVLGVNAAADVTAGTAVVTGSFPINGNSMAVGTVTDLGYLNIATVNTTNFPATIDPGVTANELFRFNVTANDQQMNLESIKLTVVGTVGNNDITNLMLKDTAGTQIGSTITTMNASKELIFDATANPYAITSGQTKTLVVYGDVPLGSGRAFRFTIRKVSDIVVKDNGYGIYTAPSYNSAAFTIIDPDSTGDGTNINNGTITAGLATDTPVNSVAAGATGVVIAKFTLKANGEDVKVNTLYVGTDEDSNNHNLKNGKILWNGSQVGSTDLDVTDDETPTAGGVSFTVNQVIPAGTTAIVSYVLDTIHYDDSTTDLSSETLSAHLVASTADATGQSSLANVAITGVSGKTLTLNAGTLTVTKNLALGDMSTASPTGVKGSLGVKVASMVISAATGEGSAITQIAVRDNNSSHSANESFGHNFQNLKLMTGSTQLGTTMGTLAHAGGDTYTFNISPAYTLAAGQQLVVDVYADVLSNAPGYITLGNAVGLESASVTGTGLLTSAATTDTNTAGTIPFQKLYISANGNLVISTDSTNPAAAQLVMGSTDNTIGAFRFDAGTSSEAINVSMINVDGGDADAAGYSNIKFYDGSTLLGTVASFDSNNDAILNLATAWVIPKGQAKILTIKADVNTVENTTAVAGNVPEATLAIGGASKITSIGAGSGSAITEQFATASASASQMTLVKTKVTVAASGSTPSGAAGKSTESTVAIFRFSNSSNVAGQQAKVTDLAIDIATSGSWTQLALGSTTSVKVYKNSVTTGNLLAAGPLASAPVSVAFGGWTVTNDANPAASSVTDFTIASGSYIDIYVTCNTTGAPAQGTFTASIPSSSGVKWEDGIHTGTDLVTVDTLPVTGGTLIF